MNGVRRDALQSHADQSGQALVLLAIAMMAMLFAIGLAVDAGQLFVARRTAQDAADAAAYAGAVVLFQEGTPAQAQAAAVDEATTNGYTNGVNGVSVTARHIPLTGAYAGSPLHVEVIITTPVQTALVPQQAGFTSVTVRGVAGATPAATGFALLTTSRAAASAFDVGGSGTLAVTGGDIIVNSSNPNGTQNSGFGITLPPQFSTRVVGGAQGVFPNLVTGVPAIADPYAGFPKPSTTGLLVCTSLAAPGCQDASVPPHQNPGVYQNVDFTVPVILNPGIYVLAGSSIHNSASGTGVFIFLTNANYPAAGGICGEFHVGLPFGAPSAVINLTPPTTGTYQNFAYYQDPFCKKPFHLRDFSSTTMTGTVYLPQADFDISSSGTTATFTQLVSLRFNISSSSTVNVNYSDAGTAKALLPALSE